MRRYYVPVNAVAVTTAKDLIRISAPATMALIVTRAWVGQSSGVTSEQGLMVLQRASNAQAGTTTTPQPLAVGDPAATFTCETITADHTLTGVPLGRPFNWVVGDELVFAPEERIWVPPSGRLVYRLATAPAASKTVTAGLIVIEVA